MEIYLLVSVNALEWDFTWAVGLLAAPSLQSEIHLGCERLSYKSPLRYFGFRKCPGSSCDHIDNEVFVIHLSFNKQRHSVL